MCGGGGDASGEIEAQNRARQEAIQKGMGNIEKAFAGFGPEYFNNIRETTTRQLLPQFGRQYKRAQKGVVYALADRGLMRGSAAREAGTDLAIEKATGEMEVANRGNEAVRQRRMEIEDRKNVATNQLITSQDPTLAAQSAVSGVAGLSAPSMVAPLGEMFRGFSDTWMAGRLANAYGGGGSEVQQSKSNLAPLPNNYIK